MISKNQIDYVASWELKSERACHPSHRTAVIQLSLLLELRQQLKYEIRNNLLNKRKLDSVLVSLQNTFVLDACEIINKVLGVEGSQK